LIRLEREKTVGLEKSLSKERKSFKVQEDLLKAKIDKLLDLEKSLAKEKEKVESLTKEFSLANDLNPQLKSANETLQENFSCLFAKHTDLEVEHDILKESTNSISNEATKSFISITSSGCKRCCNVNFEFCATNLAEMHVMKSKITRPTKLINEDSTSPKVGEFEKHTKGFGSGYMMKYGFEKGNCRKGKITPFLIYSSLRKK
jgi:chromosome segregation ATPase